MPKLDYQIASTHQIHQDIAQRLNRYRIHLELTQQELADEAGISVPTLSRLLNGKGATLDTFLRVLKAMNLVEVMAAYIPAMLPTRHRDKSRKTLISGGPALGLRAKPEQS